jgi:hypothetical protein
MAGTLEPAHLARLEHSVRDILDDLGTRPVAPLKVADQAAVEAISESANPGLPSRVFCLPGRADRDELAGEMLAHLLQQQGIEAECASGKLVYGELVGLVEKAESDLVCISIVAPTTVIHACYLCTKLREKIPKVKIVIGLWGRTGDRTEATKRLRDSGADVVVSSLAEAVTYIGNLPRRSPRL